MDHTLNHHIMAAEIQIQNQEFEKAIESYLHALQDPLTPEQQIDVHNNLAQLYLKVDDVDNSIVHYRKALESHEKVEDPSHVLFQINKAGIFNNLGAIYGNQSPNEAIEYHKKALEIIRTTYEHNNEEYIHHLVNTLYTLGGLYYQTKDLYQASKCFNEVIESYKPFEKLYPEQVQPLLASTYFQMGVLRSDQDKDEDARTFYHKAKYLYERLMEENPEIFRPYLASVYNNLAVVDRLMGYLSDSKKYYKKTVEHYKILADKHPEVFLAYYASSLNNVANVYADSWNPEDDVFSGDRGFLPGFGLFNSSAENGIDTVDALTEEDFIEAEKYYKEALTVYQMLADQEPENYQHYCATTLHNLGVLYDESKYFEKAEHYYNEALGIRKKLAELEPQAFDLDVCITQMNLVTMFQTLMERKVDISYKARCLDLIKETEKRLSKYAQDSLPESIQALVGDLEYFKDYFSRITQADLVAIDLSVKADLLNEEAYSTMDLEKRLSFQIKIKDLYQEALKQYPEHKGLINGLEVSLTEVDQTKNALINK